MQEILKEVLVFKTNINNETDLGRVATLLNREPDIRKWNVDQNDVDNILRIEAYELTADQVIALICGAGFQCEELPD